MGVRNGQLGRTFIALTLSLVLVADLATVATAQEVGPRGPAGPTGPRGPVGPAGPAGPGDPEGQRDPKVRPASREHGDSGVQPEPGESPGSLVRT